MRVWQREGVTGELPKRLKLKDNLAIPAVESLGRHDVLVKVVSASLNPADYKVPELPFVGALMSPSVPAMDYSGFVHAVHPSNRELTVGQAVFGRIDMFSLGQRQGALSEYLVASKGDYVPLGDDISFDDGASIGTAGLTAFAALKGDDLAGKTIFINGGSGGTGMFAIQIAKSMGAHVVTSCSTTNVSLCKELGADEVIDYKTTEILQALRARTTPIEHTVDLVGLDLRLYKQAHTYMTPTGKFVQVGGGTFLLGRAIACSIAPRLIGGNALEVMMLKQTIQDFVQIRDWIQAGNIKVLKDTVFKFSQVPEAYSRLKTGRARGKIIVRVCEENQ